MEKTHVLLICNNGRKIWIARKFVEHHSRVATLHYSILSFCRQCGERMIVELNASENYCPVCKQVQEVFTMIDMAVAMK